MKTEDVKTFFRETNNGITALISDEDYYRLVDDSTYQPKYYTFAHAKDANGKSWLTGSYELLDTIVRTSQCIVAKVSSQGSIFVPYSSHELEGRDSNWTLEYLQRYSATFEQVLEGFGLKLTKTLVKVEV